MTTTTKTTTALEQFYTELLKDLVLSQNLLKTKEPH